MISLTVRLLMQFIFEVATVKEVFEEVAKVAKATKATKAVVVAVLIEAGRIAIEEVEVALVTIDEVVVI